MAEIWETTFAAKQEIWGQAPSPLAIMAKDLFIKESVSNILIPGYGYGRNAQLFTENGMQVTGIEISGTAIEIARKNLGNDIVVYHGAVTDMPFDDVQYDGIFCHALIHLLDEQEREKLISDCYKQLSDGGWMVFTAISKQAHTYGTGKPIGKDRFEIHDGIYMYFYDKASITEAFAAFGLTDITEAEDNFPFYVITCRK